MRWHAFRHTTIVVLLSIGLAACAPLPLKPVLRVPMLQPTLHVPILMYHYISANPNAPRDPIRTGLSVPPALFAQQLAYLHEAGYTTIALDDLVDALNLRISLPLKPVILTFDDGYLDFLTNAYPLLQRFRDKATIYIITHKVGTAGYLSWRQLRMLAESPLITVGAHTRTHPELPSLSAARSWDELAGSKADLEARLGIVVRHLAYPSGHYSATTLMQGAQIGFATAVTTEPGVDASLDRLLTLPRVRVNGGAPLADLIAGLENRRAQAPPAPKPHPGAGAGAARSPAWPRRSARQPLRSARQAGS